MGGEEAKTSGALGGKAIADPKAHWHVFMLAAWMVILWILVVAGTAVTQVNLGCTRYELFNIHWRCGIYNNDVAVVNWDLSNTGCGGYKSHLQGAGAFAILSIFAIMAAIAVVVVQDILELFKVHDLLSGIVSVVAWFFMMITWSIVAGFRNTKICSQQGAISFADQGATYSDGFYLYLIPWCLTIVVLVMWFLKVFKILPF